MDVRIRSFVLALAGVAALLVAGCEERLPTAPSELTKGIVVYDRANFGGHSGYLTKSVGDLGLLPGPCEAVDSGASRLNLITGSTSSMTSNSCDDCIYSIRVAPGTHATVYRDPDFHGESFEINSDVPDLKPAASRMNHEISSIRIVSP